MMRVLIFILCFSFVKTFGQNSIRDTFRINNYALSIDTNKKLTRLITEGRFWKRKGGWSTSTYYNRKDDSIYKIVYHDNLDKNIYLTFYFQQNRMVLSKVELENWGQGDVLYSSIYYYDHDSVFLKYQSHYKAKYRKRIKNLNEVEVIKEGYKMLNERIKDLQEEKDFMKELNNWEK